MIIFRLAKSDRKSFRDQWDTLKANRNWRCVWTTSGDSNTEAYCVPEIDNFLIPKKSFKFLIRVSSILSFFVVEFTLFPPLNSQNLDYFQLKDIHQHLQENPCLYLLSKNETWKRLKAQGWRGMATDKYLRPPIRYVPAQRRVTQLTPGFHIFSSMDNLLTFIAR